MIPPFHRPREVHVQSILLIGYRLYPFADLELHPRLTLLAGGNGVGKTTLLDAVQTVLVADQRYLHLNVASGQNDRDLGGQLRDRVGWAVLVLNGHRDVHAIGVLLSRKPSMDLMEIKPFALYGITPDQQLFVNEKTGQVTHDLRTLGTTVKVRASGGRVRDFASLSEYHRFLFDEGLMPLDLSRGGKKPFSLLWRQATQPHLGELSNFLQQTLCHEPEKRLTFQDVERLMKERLETERSLTRLGELRELTHELQATGRDMDHHRRRYLGINIGITRRRELDLQRDIQEMEAKSQQIEERLGSLGGELASIRERLSGLNARRDACLREQNEWSRKYRAHQDYQKHAGLLEVLQWEMAPLLQELQPLERLGKALQEESEALRATSQAVGRRLAALRERQKDLGRKLSKWLEFKKDLEEAGEIVGTKVLTREDMERAWSEVNEKRRLLHEVKGLKQLCLHWESRVRSHEQARAMAEQLILSWPEAFEDRPLTRDLLEWAQDEIRRLENAVAQEKHAMAARRKELSSFLEELQRGGVPLKGPAASLVREGKARPFLLRFDTFPLDMARACQESIGPFVEAVEPAGCEDRLQGTDACGDQPGGREEVSMNLDDLARGQEGFLLVLSPHVWKEMKVLGRSPEGAIAGMGGIAWYTPKGRVSIGEQARQEQIQEAGSELEDLKAREQKLSTDEGVLRSRRKAVMDFMPKIEAFEDTESVEKAAELRQKLLEASAASSHVEQSYEALQRVFQKSELFDFVKSHEENEAARREVEVLEEEYRSVEGALKEKAAKGKDARDRAGTLKAQLDAVRRESDKAEAICARLKDEEPEDVLAGKLDFGKAEAMQEQIRRLDQEKEEVRNMLFSGERKSGELQTRFKTLGESLTRMRQELEQAARDHQRTLTLWTEFYAREEPLCIMGVRADERERHRAVWENLSLALKARISGLSEKYGVHFSATEEPDRLVPQILDLLLPAGVKIEQLEDQYLRLQKELEQIEYKIKSRVEEVRSNVETEIRRLRMRLVKVNRILSTLHFGNIERISLELDELPAYAGLQKLESVLRRLKREAAVTLKEFVEGLRSFIHKEANVLLSEEQLADYRSYIRLRRVIVDREGKVRNGGLSSGETLGVNMALCLAVLFFLGREQGNHAERGMLFLVLDEAERLDARALDTIRDLLDEVRCQLTVAMPRPVSIADSICHLLTPLSQGVTHVHLYHKARPREA